MPTDILEQDFEMAGSIPAAAQAIGRPSAPARGKVDIKKRKPQVRRAPLRTTPIREVAQPEEDEPEYPLASFPVVFGQENWQNGVATKVPNEQEDGTAQPYFIYKGKLYNGCINYWEETRIGKVQMSKLFPTIEERDASEKEISARSLAVERNLIQRTQANLGMQWGPSPVA